MNFVPAVFRVHLVVRRSVWRFSLREPSVSWTLIQQRQAKCAWSQRRKPLTGPAGGKRQKFLVCTLLSATFLRACTLERLFVAHNPNERRPKLRRPTSCGAQQSAARYGIDPSQHSPSERSPIAHVLISLALAPNDAQPKSPPPNGAPS